MQVFLLKSKIHRATVTDGNVNYEGSLTIAADLMESCRVAGIRTHPVQQHGQRQPV